MPRKHAQSTVPRTQEYHSYHHRDKGIICETFYDFSHCFVINCPYAHIKDGSTHLLPQMQCAFWIDGRCLREGCAYFHGHIEDLQALRKAGQTIYCPAQFMPRRNPLAVLSAYEAELKASDLPVGPCGIGYEHPQHWQTEDLAYNSSSSDKCGTSHPVSVIPERWAASGCVPPLPIDADVREPLPIPPMPLGGSDNQYPPHVGY
jgi:hypothetical protein